MTLTVWMTILMKHAGWIIFFNNKLTCVKNVRTVYEIHVQTGARIKWEKLSQPAILFSSSLDFILILIPARCGLICWLVLIVFQFKIIKQFKKQSLSTRMFYSSSSVFCDASFPSIIWTVFTSSTLPVDDVARKIMKQPRQSNNLFFIEYRLCRFRSFLLLSFVLFNILELAALFWATWLIHDEGTVTVLHGCNK